MSLGEAVNAQFAPLPTPTTRVELFSVAGADGYLRHVNSSFAELLAVKPGDLDDRSLLELIHPHDLPQVVAALASLSAGHPEVMVENRFARSDGMWVHLQWVARPIPDSELWWAAGRDTTAFHRLRAEGADLRARLNLAAGGAAAMWQLDFSTGALSWEDQAASLLATLHNELPVTVEALATLVGADGDQVEAAMSELGTTGSMEVDVCVQAGDGPTRHLSIRGTVLERDRRARPLRAVGLVLDITTAKAMEEQMLRMVMSDPLTGAPNRRAFDQTLRTEWRRSMRTDDPLSVLIIDIDNFKNLNDTHGHLVGDAALTAVWRALDASARQGGVTVARFGGEEFAIALPSIDVSGALAVAERCCESVRAVRIAQAPDRQLSVSVGTATRNAHHTPTSVTRLVARADQALYAAKASGKDCAIAYETSLAGAAEAEDLIREGLRSDQFVMHYQPVINLTTGAVTAFEALMRWNRPGHGLLGPDAFIPLAERSDLINDIGRRALRLAAHEAARWRRAWSSGSTERVKVAVNLSGRHILDPRVLDDISAALNASSLEPDGLIIELSESGLTNVDTLTQHLGQIRAMGVEVVIDDFGTGHTSMGQMPDLQADTLKIDRSFIASTETRQRDLVDLMTSAAHSFGLSVVAKGVETGDQLRWLRAVGCGHAQGFAISRPLPGDQVDHWVNEWVAEQISQT